MRNKITLPRSITVGSLFSFLGVVILFQAMGGLMGWITSTGIDGWYQDLARSPLNPPDYLFGIAWTILYFLLSVAFFLLLRSPKTKERTFALWLFAFHMLLNWAWSPLFFVAHALFAAFALIALLVMTGAYMAFYFKKINNFAAAFLLPYLAWLCFAGHLSYFIWAHNG